MEYAITRFKSFCNKPVVAAKKDVAAPTIAMYFNTQGMYSNNIEHLAIKKTPAVTMVAA